MLSSSPLSFLPGSKNNEKCEWEYYHLNPDTSFDWINHAGTEAVHFLGSIDKRLIQMYFCRSGEMTFSFYGGRYTQILKQGSGFLFYNPLADLPQELILSPGSQAVCLYITVEHLHQLFVQDLSELPFLTEENINKKFYAERPIKPALRLVLDQMFHDKTLPSNRRVYFMGKIWEMLSLYFNQEADANIENCPFLLDENNVLKIRLAKKILLERMVNPPGIKELSREIGLNEHQLKLGFKNIYSKSIFQYLTDYKMEYARKLLDRQSHKVNEVSDLIGYSNPSHFIAAFKRKYGITPKKYIMARI
ncbi:MAG: helix-turn-helix transcriptional regulator [Bacteroidota bacterium]